LKELPVWGRGPRRRIEGFTGQKGGVGGIAWQGFREREQEGDDER